MKVVGLWRYPVKSLQGERLDGARIEEDGVAGDRRWGIRDQRTGRILTARRRPELLAAAAAYDGEEPVLTLPGGRTVAGAGKRTDALLSEWLGSPVSLVSSRASEAGRAEFFADPTDDTSPAIEWTMPEARFVDAAPLLVITTASLEAAAALHPGGAWDARRFRPNVLVDVDGDGQPPDGWVEDGWVGASVRAGSAVVTPTEACMRCTMVTRPQPGLDADVDIFRTLARQHRGRFGVWCDVGTPGEVAVGDAVSVTR